MGRLEGRNSKDRNICLDQRESDSGSEKGQVVLENLTHLSQGIRERKKVWKELSAELQGKKHQRILLILLFTQVM